MQPTLETGCTEVLDWEEEVGIIVLPSIEVGGA